MFYNDPRKIVDLITLTMNAQIAQNGKKHKNGPNSLIICPFLYQYEVGSYYIKMS